MPTAAELALLITAKNDASKAMDDVAKSAGGLGKTLGDVGKVAGGFLAAGAITAGAGALVGGIKGAIGAASDANETLSKSNTIFKQNAGEIEAWASGAAKGFGQSKTQALEAAGTFGNMFTQLGIATPQAANMSKSMVQLASDFASFHNADVSEVLAAQTAAFRGEFDAVQRFVPTINAAAVETEALAQSGKKNAKELTNQEKALATQTLLMRGAGEAAGDFARTSDGLANRQRILGAQMADLKSKIGQALLPVMVELAGIAVNVVIPAISKLGGILVGAIGPPIAKAAGAIRGFVSALRGGGGAVSSFGKSTSQIGGLVAKIGPAVQAAIGFITQAFDKLKQYWASDLQPAAQNLLTAFKAVVAGLVAAFITILPVLKPLFDQMINTMKTLATVWGNIVAIIVDLIQGDFSGAWKNAQDIFRAFVDFFTETVNNFGAYLSEFFKLLWEGIKLATAAAWDGIKALIPAAIDFIISHLDDAAKLYLEAWKLLWEGVKALASLAWDGIKQLISDAVTEIGASAEHLAQIVTDTIGGAFNGLKDTVRNALNDAIEWVNRFINRLSGREIVPEVRVLGETVVPGVRLPSLPTIPALARGTPFVPEDMLAFLHRGEAVIPAGQNAMGEVTVNIMGPVYAQDEEHARRHVGDIGYLLVGEIRARGARV